MTVLAPLDPDAGRVLALIAEARRPRWESLPVPEARASYAAGRTVLQPEPEPVAEIRDLTVPGVAGDIAMRLYRPEDVTEPAPALVFFHGGGWVLGGLDSHDGVCRTLGRAGGCVVVAVDYRLAPEHPFPAAVEDSVSATRWVLDHAASLGIDPARVAVGGDSAGGNLAAVVCLAARDEDWPVKPVAQLLIYPAVDFAQSHPSYARVTEGVPLTADTMRWFGGLYLSSEADRADWRASPLRAERMTGLPPAVVITAGHDPLCDEGRAYAERLAAADVRVAHLHLADQIHGFVTMGRLIRAATTSLRWAGMALRPAFGYDEA